VNATAALTRATDNPVLGAATRLPVRPRYEGSNIGVWLGFKHLNYMVEEAVLDHFRQYGYGPASLYEAHGLCLDLVDIDTRILHSVRMDDVAIADVRPARRQTSGGLNLAVTLLLGDPEVKTVASKVRVVLRQDAPDVDVPADLRPFVAPRIGGTAEPAPAGDNVFVWKWRIPYFYCHFTERMQMSGYLRVMEEVVDRFLADRGVSIKTLLDEQRWIPAVPHSRITLLGEALMEEELVITFTVEEVFKRFTYTARMDCHVVRDGRVVPTATGRITHGYAKIDSRSDWGLITFDDRLTDALSGTAAVSR
jgi:acyl-CoA thioesterase FadM